ncbi:hypothetical protein NDU88_004648 [Pleurodeles waltl]|uniref:Uncharacterized protein n=1 Tax=Pleurodeles waltl TaxID=8319 RepID=A0AAV7M8D5_PLEWA|nr:hypothetical protein NDU88_004648 [Pleurodeles waltl]
MDAAAQEVISEVLGAYQHTQDTMGQIVATLEQNQRLQIAHHQEATEQWKQLNATMATIALALLHHFPTQPETPTDQEYPTTDQDTDQPSTAAAATGLVPQSKDTQKTSTSTRTGQHQAPKRSFRPRYGTGTPAKTKAPSKCL